MKKRTAASTILISLAAVVGCNSGDADYVNYNQTTPSEFEENQKQLDVLPRDEGKVDAPSPDLTPAVPSSAAPPESSDVKLKSSEVASAGAASPSSGSTSSDQTDSDSGNLETPIPNVDDSAPASTSTTPTTIVSVQSGLRGRADMPEIDNGAEPVANKIELLIPEKSFRRERGTDAVRVSYDDIDLLKVLNMEPVPPNAVEYFPEWLASLNGKRIRIRGFMYPKYIQEGITSFTLARDNGICCFQRMPKIYDVIFVKLEPGQTTDYIDARPFDVEGTFRFDNEDDGNELPRLYKIENARVLD